MVYTTTTNIMAELCEHATERRGAEVFWTTHAGNDYITSVKRSTLSQPLQVLVKSSQTVFFKHKTEFGVATN